VADRVDASVHADEPAGLHSMCDGARDEPRIEELCACDESVLAGGDSGRSVVGCVN
jgi:hypothetical protein